LFYSVYSLPNIVLPLFGGLLIDKLGIRVGLFLFSSIIAIGQAIFAFGVSSKQYWIALLGRFVFGLGGETLGVASCTIMFNWFKNKELALAMGMTLSVANIGSVVNDLIEPEIYEQTGSVVMGVWIGFAVCVGSVLCGLIVNWIDIQADRRLGIVGKPVRMEDEMVRFSDIRSFKPILWLLCANGTSVFI
jgi:nitrate/nitrite transporter NarK